MPLATPLLLTAPVVSAAAPSRHTAVFYSVALPGATILAHGPTPLLVVSASAIATVGGFPSLDTAILLSPVVVRRPAAFWILATVLSSSFVAFAGAFVAVSPSFLVVSAAAVSAAVIVVVVLTAALAASFTALGAAFTTLPAAASTVLCLFGNCLGILAFPLGLTLVKLTHSFPELEYAELF